MDALAIENLTKRAKSNIAKHNITALFCDEVHSLQDKFVGMFCHTGTPANSLPVYNKPTSLTYIFVTAMEELAAHSVGVCFTTL